MDISYDKADYRAFYSHLHLPKAPLCCAPWYLDAVCTDGQWDAVIVLDQGRAIGAWPYFHKQRWKVLHYATMPLFTKHMGPLILPDEAQEQVFNALLSAQPRLAGIDQQWHPMANDWVSHLSDDWQPTEHYLHRIDLTTPWRTNINRNMRRNIRKAEGQLQLLETLDLSTFYRVNTMSFTRQGLPMPYTFAQLAQHDAALEKHNRRRIFTAIDAEKRIHSVAYLMWDDHAAYYHLSGDDPELRRSGAGIWLIAQALDYTRDVLRLPVFDFEGSMLPAVAKIREQFGAQRHSYYRVQQAQSWMYRMLKRMR